MSEPRPKPALRRQSARESIRVVVDQLAAARPPSENLPVATVSAVTEGVSLSSWAHDHGQVVAPLLERHGAVLFRGFHTSDLADFARFVRFVSGEPIEYRERSSPRTHVSDRVYTSTEYPSHQAIFLHNENSYAHSWPLKLFFLCVAAPQQGGETPFADCRAVYLAIPAEIRERFARQRVLYLRNFSEQLGVPWQVAFGTSDRGAVEAQLRASGYELQWLDANRLRTRRHGQAVARHPRTGEMSWFNHATFFHVSTLSADVAGSLVAEFGEEGVPNNTYYGDGTAIEPDVLDTLRRCYLDAKVTVPWQRGDVLMLDNMLSAHGRERFAGPREIRVAMSEPCGEHATGC